MKKTPLLTVLFVCSLTGCLRSTSQGGTTTHSDGQDGEGPPASAPSVAAVEDSSPDTQPVEKASSESVEKTEAGGDFVFDLYRKLVSGGENLFFSPFSLTTALGMTYAGARGNTEKQMSEVLGFPSPQDPLHDETLSILKSLKKLGGVKLHAANALWPSKRFTLDSKYKGLVQKKYAARVVSLDYTRSKRARKTINQWAEKNTKGKIKELLAESHVDASTLMVLTNAIYFNGPWAIPFKPSHTRDAGFHVNDKKTVNVPMMKRVGKVGFLDDGSVKVLELPYKGDRFVMIVVLPNLKDGLPNAEKRLSQAQVSKWVSELREQRISVSLPKFNIESQLELKLTLIELGLVEAFTDAADFSGMVPSEKNLKVGPMRISDVIHKAVVEVGEEGTEAAAATAVMVPTSLPNSFVANHPFVFIIRDKEKGKNLFVGRLVDPTS